MKSFVITMLIVQLIGAVICLYQASEGEDLFGNLSAGIIQVGFVAWAVCLLGGM